VRDELAGRWNMLEEYCICNDHFAIGNNVRIYNSGSGIGKLDVHRCLLLKVEWDLKIQIEADLRPKETTARTSKPGEELDEQVRRRPSTKGFRHESRLSLLTSAPFQGSTCEKSHVVMRCSAPPSHTAAKSPLFMT
jgi:hypothetical protein